MSATLPHQTSMRYIARLNKYQANVWAVKLRAKVADPAYAGRTTEEILTGLGMDDPDMQSDVLRAYARLLPEEES